MKELSELYLLNMIAEESAKAKQLLREAGFGVTGTNLLETVKECLEELNEYHREEEMEIFGEDDPP